MGSIKEGSYKGPYWGPQGVRQFVGTTVNCGNTAFSESLGEL